MSLSLKRKRMPFWQIGGRGDLGDVHEHRTCDGSASLLTNISAAPLSRGTPYNVPEVPTSPDSRSND